jgi:hypothetical protein
MILIIVYFNNEPKQKECCQKKIGRATHYV